MIFVLIQNYNIMRLEQKSELGKYKELLFKIIKQPKSY